jgi:hypothetical protein
VGVTVVGCGDSRLLANDVEEAEAKLPTPMFDSEMKRVIRQQAYFWDACP